MALFAANHLMSPGLRQAWIKAANNILRYLIATHNDVGPERLYTFGVVPSEISGPATEG
jgi:hypothetical protein